jgi:hypothetical protein
MEHLPRPRDSIYELETIPYLCNEEYDNLPFLEFPRRLGWESDQRTFADSISAHSKPEVNTFIQTWLWFGLGYEILGPEFSKRNFTRREGEVEVLTTSPLAETTTLWAGVQRRAFPAIREASFEHFIKCLQLALNTLVELDKPQHQGKLDDANGRSVLALGEALHTIVDRCYKWICKEEGYSQGDYITEVLTTWPTLSYIDPYYQQLLQKRNWCQSEWGNLRPRYSGIAKLHFFANLEPPKTTVDHSECTARICKSYQINMKKYQTKHVAPDCQCTELLVENQHEVEEILAQGGLPVLFMEEDNEQFGKSVTLRVEKWTQDYPYVAISHVWADGMGNPERNALPTCQLLKIKDLVDALPNHVPKESRKGIPPEWMNAMTTVRQTSLKNSLTLSVIQSFLLSMEQLYEPLGQKMPMHHPDDVAEMAKCIETF